MSSGSLSEGTEIEFKEIAEQICANYADVKKNISELDTNLTIVDVNTLFVRYEEEVKKWSAKIESTTEAPELEDFEELFKDLDDFQPNIPKQKKTQKESFRLSGASTKTSSPSLNVAVDLEDTLSSSSTSFTDTVLTESEAEELDAFFDELQLFDDISLSKSNGSKPENILESFKTFEEKLKKVQFELKSDGANADYSIKLLQLQGFSTQLEKLFHKEPNQNAFTDMEKSTLYAFLESLDNLDYLQQNGNVFQYPTKKVLDDCLIMLDELLTDALNSITK